MTLETLWKSKWLNNNFWNFAKDFISKVDIFITLNNAEKWAKELESKWYHIHKKEEGYILWRKQIRQPYPNNTLIFARIEKKTWKITYYSNLVDAARLQNQIAEPK